MANVVRRDGESFDSLLKRFRSKVIRSRILSEVKRRRWFVSKGEQRRIAQRKAARRHRRRQRQEEWRYGKA
jgi:small subunit ribosomal protein S21